MAPLIEAERWCEQVVARSLVTARVVDCHRPAVSICPGCGSGMCEEHSVICPECGVSFCVRCDHLSPPDPGGVACEQMLAHS